jgi:membrane protein DedA with SNARE-associated domain
MFQALDSYAQDIVEFARAHEVWAIPIAFMFAFGESLAFVSLFIPAWAALVGLGALIEAGELKFWPIWVSGALGAAIGDWVSYWVGINIGPPVAEMWPPARYPALLPRGISFVRRWGVAAIFIGRFFGPLRASVPLAAGIFRMPYWHFQLANFTSAFLWAGVLLGVGDIVTTVFEWVLRRMGGAL